MKKNGFTLFELLISVSIIGILTALAVISYSSAQRKARDAKRMQDLQTMQKSLEEYYALSTYTYPTNTTGSWTTPNGQIVLERIPLDPKNVAPQIYVYSNMTGADYCICSTMENDNSGNSNAQTCAAGTFVAGGDYYCVKAQQ